METINNTLESAFMKIYKTDGLTEALKDLFNYENDYILSVYEGVIRNFLKELKKIFKNVRKMQKYFLIKMLMWKRLYLLVLGKLKHTNFKNVRICVETFA